MYAINYIQYKVNLSHEKFAKIDDVQNALSRNNQ